MFRTRILLATVVVALLLSACSGPDSSTGGVSLTGPTNGAERIQFDLLLKPSNESMLDAYLTRTLDPASPEYRHQLTRQELLTKFSVSSHVTTRVASWLRDRDLSVTSVSMRRTLLRVTGSVAAVERVFGVELENYRDDNSGHRGHLVRGEVQIPRALRPFVTSVAGLDGRFAPRRTGRRQESQPDPPGTCLRARTCLSARDVADLYGITPLHDAGVLGQGESVAIFMDHDVSPADIAQFDREMHIDGAPPVKVRKVAPISAEEFSTPEDEQQAISEATMDVETVRMIAPKAQIYLYLAPLGDFAEQLEQVVKDDHAHARIASYSAGACEAALTSNPYGQAVRAANNTALVDAVAARPAINVFVSSGDQGIFDCSLRGDWTVSTDYPASSSYAIGVGGTYVERTTDGRYLDEAAWGSPLTNWATGGGNDSVESRPAWQRGPGVQNPYSVGHRQVPDVAGPGADPQLSWPIVVNGTEQHASGTSASSPFWAGLTALFSQFAKRSGIDDLGPLGPTLYAVAAAHRPNTVFHDIVRGGNLGYSATPGWDYATGLGTPIANRLGAAIVAYLRAHPARRR